MNKAAVYVSSFSKQLPAFMHLHNLKYEVAEVELLRSQHPKVNQDSRLRTARICTTGNSFSANQQWSHLDFQQSTASLCHLALYSRKGPSTVRAPGLPRLAVPVCSEDYEVRCREGKQACQSRRVILYTTRLRIACCCLL